MFDLLTKSKIRQKIILLFLYNQKKEYFLSEIARLTGTSAGTAQRENNRLLKDDLLTFHKKGNLNLYRLNKKFALLNEIESIVRKTIGVEVELKKELRKIKGISFTFLFGSYVTGGFKSDSDIDLFVLGSASEDLVFKAVQKVEKIIGREINYHVTGEKEFFNKIGSNAFYKDIVKNHLLLVGEENEFRKIIKNSR